MVDACPTATASRSGRSPRWSAARRHRRPRPGRRRALQDRGTARRGIGRRIITDHVAASWAWPTSPYPVQETFWAIRGARSRGLPRSLVVGFDDIHWAEPTFLDLLEYLWGWSRTSPILIVCSARPELLEARAGWGKESSKPSAGPAQSAGERLVIEHLLDGGGLDAGLRARISDVTEGTPLRGGDASDAR